MKIRGYKTTQYNLPADLVKRWQDDLNNVPFRELLTREDRVAIRKAMARYNLTTPMAEWATSYKWMDYMRQELIAKYGTEYLLDKLEDELARNPMATIHYYYLVWIKHCDLRDLETFGAPLP